jgi:hypothetical protein
MSLLEVLSELIGDVALSGPNTALPRRERFRFLVISLIAVSLVVLFAMWLKVM